MSYFPLSDADAATKGLIQLAGDIGGSAGSPTVPALAGKADASDVYTKAQVDTALGSKADASALTDYIPAAQIGAADGVAALDSGGKVPMAQLQLSFPVTSVNTQTGDVVLTKSDVGLGNVDNTSDANKPISSATQTALDGKAGSAHTHSIADVTSLQTTLDGKASVTHSHAIADVTGLQTALDAKAAASHTHPASEISDSSAVGRSVLTAADQLTAQSALGITNTVVVVNAFGDVTTPSYGTLYVVRA